MRGIAEIFICFSLEDFCNILTRWQRLAMANDESAYDSAATREDLMDYCKELQRLAQAFFILNIMQVKKHKGRRERNLEMAMNKYISVNMKVARHRYDISNPVSYIKKFCTRFSFGYAKTEILDLLEAVITYNGVKKVRNENLVLFYQCLDFMIDVTYLLGNGKKCLHRLKKRIGEVRSLKRWRVSAR
jgi:hypothetical protein